MIIDGDGLILGRLASRVAKELLKGNSITIINAEKIVLSGDPKRTIKRFFEKREVGSHLKGPFYPREPDKVVRRAIRGMLPYKKEKGKIALKKLKVYKNSNNMKGEKIGKSVNDLKTKYATLKQVCEGIGYNA